MKIQFNFFSYKNKFNILHDQVKDLCMIVMKFRHILKKVYDDTDIIWKMVLANIPCTHIILQIP